jgi:nicotinamide mononucleotide transporter
MTLSYWLSDNYIEVFGALTGIIYVILEIRQTIWLWPVGIITSAVYIWVFFTSKFYADMSLQGYYLVISCLGWYWWARGSGLRAKDLGHRNEEEKGRGGDRENGRLRDTGTIILDNSENSKVVDLEKRRLPVARLNLRTGIILIIVFIILYALMWFILSGLTDSPVPGWDSFITSLSIVATWMLARKIYEHWFLWIVVNSVSAVLFLSRGLYPTVLLYVVYGLMSFVGLIAWKKTIPHPPTGL